MSELSERLREAHPNSQQYALGSNILLEAAQEIESLQAQLSEARRELEQLARKIHYPDCWDTSVYPTLSDALNEIGCNPDCCTQQPQGGEDE